jgi:hypothetical protein
MLAGIFASLAEYERELINERASDARAAAAARDKQTGRPSKLNADQARQLRSVTLPVSRWPTCVAASRSAGYGVPGARRGLTTPCPARPGLGGVGSNW